jgi:hypothetical protein
MTPIPSEASTSSLSRASSSFIPILGTNTTYIRCRDMPNMFRIRVPITPCFMLHDLMRLDIEDISLNLTSRKSHVGTALWARTVVPPLDNQTGGVLYLLLVRT